MEPSDRLPFDANLSTARSQRSGMTLGEKKKRARAGDLRGWEKVPLGAEPDSLLFEAYGIASRMMS